MQALTKKQILLNNISVLENDDIIDTINNIVDFEIAKNFSLNKLTKEDLIERALISEDDYKNGNITNLEQLKEESERW